MRISDWSSDVCSSDLLAHAYGDGFQMPMPPDGKQVQVPSTTAALARLVEWRYNDLGALNARDGDPAPVLNALFAPHEPTTGTDGTLAWVADVRNPFTDDDFVRSVVHRVGKACASMW